MAPLLARRLGFGGAVVALLGARALASQLGAPTAEPPDPPVQELDDGPAARP